MPNLNSAPGDEGYNPGKCIIFEDYFKMKNKLDKLFGPVGTSAGLFVFIAGLLISSFSLTGLFFILLGAFIGFSYTGTRINFEQKKIKFSNYLFGFIPTGKWINIQPDMKIRIKKTKRVWRAYSRSNRTIDIDENDYRLILYDSSMKEIM